MRSSDDETCYPAAVPPCTLAPPLQWVWRRATALTVHTQPPLTDACGPPSIHPPTCMQIWGPIYASITVAICLQDTVRAAPCPSGHSSRRQGACRGSWRPVPGCTWAGPSTKCSLATCLLFALVPGGGFPVPWHPSVHHDGPGRPLWCVRGVNTQPDRAWERAAVLWQCGRAALLRLPPPHVVRGQ